ncbi:tight adherence protein B [Cohaesibacter sp. ES.047]|uniref:type II secretion system F family protein n=1 Tax=Cohaesibacter sp. ES.047 TaxID=1798205 RepID=UPI000BB9A630|nr:type II secretion system F family protein [Cohaesibacter sp. ES.047]SNY91827.1 tight adherence protein B [Cohaesibacter sp. ES.047]
MSFIGNDLIITIALFVLVVLSVLGIAWGLFYPRLSKNFNRNKRIDAIAMNRVQIGDKRNRTAGADRRKDIEASLRKIEEQQKQGSKKKSTLKARLKQAGLTMTVRQFWLYSVISGIVTFFIAMIGGLSALIALGVGFVGFLGLPHFWLARKRKKRMAKFVAEFPNAVDVIVRGIKTGLPLGDCLMIAAAETAEPVKSEFQQVIDEQAMGLALNKVLPRMHERVPIAETNFFAIVIAIQIEAGGSLAEALGNLSRVLRSRAQMKQKIGAMSMEAKASAAIIAVMPFIIAFMTYLTQPDYIMIMFIEPMGNMLLAVTLAWMALGILVMRNMVSFEI